RTVHVVLAGTSQHELTALDLLQAAVQGTDDVPVGVPENVKLIRTEHCHHTTIMHIKLQLTQANSMVWLWIAQLLASLPNTGRTLFRRDHPDLGVVSPEKGPLNDGSHRARQHAHPHHAAGGSVVRNCDRRRRPPVRHG